MRLQSKYDTWKTDITFETTAPPCVVCHKEIETIGDIFLGGNRCRVCGLGPMCDDCDSGHVCPEWKSVP